jgi:uncharacterized protein YceK
MNAKRWLVVLAAVTVLVGCSFVAIHAAPQKTASSTRTEAAQKADTLFWSTLHSGRYDEIGQALDALTSAYLANPADAVTAAHIGWMHMWRLSESTRLERVPATITDDAVLARKYFQEANRLDPAEARYLGFLAGSTMAEGNIHKDDRLIRRGYFTLLDSIEAWPEFNLFTAGYVMSRQPPDSPRFQQALEWQWQTLDLCVGEKVDRRNLDYARYMALATTNGPKRVCWNSWIAPHNFEGFFLNMGDMLVKAGDLQTARTVYAAARLSETYAQWKYRDVLELRIRNAEANVKHFNANDATSDKIHQRIMISTPFACMGCHQE